LFSDGGPLLGLERFIIDRRDVFKVPTETEIKKTNPPMVPLFGVCRKPNGSAVRTPCSDAPCGFALAQARPDGYTRGTI
jgi:hypothetical protein